MRRILWPGGVALTITGFALSLYLVFIRTAVDRELGFTQKIFYFHVPCAWVTFLAFAITAASSIVFLVTRRTWWDDLAYSSLEVGTVFTTLVLVTGPLWAKPTWGAYWVWDARLTTTLVLWLVEVAYLLLRAFIEEPERAAKYAAVLGLLGALDIPIVHYSVALWRGMHPSPVVMAREGFGAGLPLDFLVALLVSLVSFTLLFVMLTATRLRLEAVRGRLAALRHRANER